MIESQTTTLAQEEAIANAGLNKEDEGWRQFAGAMRRIKDNELYKEDGYRYFGPYYKKQWQHKSGRSLETVLAYIQSITSLEEMEQEDLPDLPPITNVNVPRVLGTIHDPSERAQFWRDFSESGEPIGAQEQNLRRAVKEHKGDLPTPVLSEDVREIMEDLPSGTLSREHKWMFRLTEIQSALDRLDPHDVAQHSLSNTKLIAHYSDRAQDTIDWLSKYIEELDKLQGTTLRVVSGGNA